MNSQQQLHSHSQDDTTSYEPVVHKKTNGKLILNTNSVCFQKRTSTNNGLNNCSSNNDENGGAVIIDIGWNKISKHQVSPAGHPRSLLKIVLIEGAGKPLTFILKDRIDLEKIRTEISDRLKHSKSQHSSLLQFSSSSSASKNSTLAGSKRRHPSSTSSSTTKTALLAQGITTSTSFGELDPTSLAVTRSSLLASNPKLRNQHKFLVEESQTITEEDFWRTHQGMLEEEYARISGITRAGTSSLLQSHLQMTGKVTLGVEEMRQIFILYPAVHKAYEEKVPLELSDEQFWRKYLESEYFHRDRGRVGAASRRPDNSSNNIGDNDTNDMMNDNKKSNKADQEARAAAVGTDDLFSRYDQKLRESGQLDNGALFPGAGGATAATSLRTTGAGAGNDDNTNTEEIIIKRQKWGTRLAIGQFDLASTFETERGNLLEGPKDNHPIDSDDTNKIGRKVIQKYNRHWAMVLNPEEAVAGSNLMDVARNSVQDSIPNDEDAMAGGGLDEEMQRLVGFAEASAQDANHALGVGESDEYELLTLKNVDGYYSGNSRSNDKISGSETEDQTRKNNIIFANAIVVKMNVLLKEYSADSGNQYGKLGDAFPPPELGRDFLKALTKRMAQDSKTDADTLEIVNSLPADFKKRLHSYFRRTSELLRHFFGLRKLMDCCVVTSNKSAYNQKLKKIVSGLELLYNEIGEMRKEQEVAGVAGFKGKTMRKMCFQIMEQLDWAFKLYREGTGSGGSGGFVTIEEF